MPTGARSAWRWMGAVACAWALGGCGEPLATGEYLGEPLLVVRGEVISNGARLSDLAALRVAIQWVGVREQIVDDQLVAQSGFGRFDLEIYTPPSDAVLRQLPEGAGRIAIGRVIMYADRDSDGRWDVDSEPIFGGSNDQLIMYAPAEVDHPTLGELVPQGYSVVFGRDCGEEDTQQVFEPSPSDAFTIFVLDESVQQEEDDYDLDLNCDGVDEDPCFELVTDLNPDEFSASEKDVLLTQCYEAEGRENDPYQTCAPERLAFLVAQDIDLPTLDRFRLEYEVCILIHDAEDPESLCPEGFEFDGEVCVCPEGFELFDAWTCVDCEAVDPEVEPELGMLCE